MVYYTTVDRMGKIDFYNARVVESGFNPYQISTICFVGHPQLPLSFEPLLIPRRVFFPASTTVAFRRCRPFHMFRHGSPLLGPITSPDAPLLPRPYALASQPLLSIAAATGGNRVLGRGICAVGSLLPRPPPLVPLSPVLPFSGPLPTLSSRLRLSVATGGRGEGVSQGAVVGEFRCGRGEGRLSDHSGTPCARHHAHDRREVELFWRGGDPGTGDGNVEDGGTESVWASG